MSLKNIALVGASGTLGPSILSALKSHPTFNPFVINRHSSKSVYPKTRVITVPDDLNVAELTKLFKDKEIDALVIAIAGSRVDEQKKLIEAAYEAGVYRVVPADFGSCDSADEETVRLFPLYEKKKEIRDLLVLYASKARGKGNALEPLTWTSLISGHFFDWGLKGDLLKFDVKARKAYILDGGNVMSSGSSLAFIADALVKILEKPDETKNKIVYVHGVYKTQNEILDLLEKATGEKFERIEQSSKEIMERVGPSMREGDQESYLEAVATWGVVSADWKEKGGFANEMLGLEEEDAEAVVKRVVKELKVE
ncbi:isoflavone reductase family protein [Amniculicola lignicola CBS 123094]|uniref:Isoflavone reductase family protein n=1 Tax=Amniculicola lignicola CBS 123094 TaxID=1392246 RepID=A0A6A5WUV2_9PLEO|nr:isoflavone reductase family protein [Amniculicola lignicola CBS 123094]